MPDVTLSTDIDAFLKTPDDASARAELGLGSAAEAATGDFATSTQGDKADTALQPADPTLDSVTTNGSTTTNNVTVGGRLATGNNSAVGANSTAIGGNGNSATGSSSEVLGGDGSSASGTGGTVVGGSNITNRANWTATLGGLNHETLSSAHRGAIVGGYDNHLNHADSVILSGNNITTDAANTVFVPNLNVGAGFKMPTGATDGYYLKSDANGAGTWQEVERGATWVYNSSGYSNQIYGDIPDDWRKTTVVAQYVNDTLVVIGTSCTNIGELAFVSHSNTNGGLAIPDSVLTIGRYAFQTYAQNATEKGQLRLPSKLQVLELGTFQNSRFIGELVLPETLTTISNNAFESAGFGGNLVIPTGVTSIGNFCFYNCNFQDTLTLPTSLVSIGTNSFRNCGNLTTINCYTTKTALDVTNSLLGSAVMTIHARSTDNTWTAGSNITIGGKTGINVIKDL